MKVEKRGGSYLLYLNYPDSSGQAFHEVTFSPTAIPYKMPGNSRLGLYYDQNPFTGSAGSNIKRNNEESEEALSKLSDEDREKLKRIFSDAK